MKVKPKSPAERFKEIAPRRVNKVLQALVSLSNCSSRNYEYSDEQVKKMFRAIKTELKATEDKFRSNGEKKERFKF